MGNCSSSSASLPFPDTKESEPSPNVKVRAASIPRIKVQDRFIPEVETSPMALTPPQKRARLMGAEIFQRVTSPQSEEPGDRAQDKAQLVGAPSPTGDTALSLGHGTEPNFSSSSPPLMKDELTSPQRANNSSNFRVRIEDSIVSPMSAGTQSTLENLDAEDSEGLMAVSTKTGTSPTAPYFNLRLSSLIDVIAIESKCVADERPGESSTDVRLPSTEREGHRNEGKLSRKAYIRIGVVLLILYYTGCLVCMGWVGARAIRSARVLFLHQNRPGFPLGKTVGAEN